MSMQEGTKFMKKIISFILIICMSLGLTSCYQDLERNSLDEYIACIHKNKCGFSSVGIDKPQYFLPSISFLEDYEYLEGTYFWHDDDSWKELFAPEDVLPDISLITLKYDESTYEEAKKTMLEEIKPYEHKFYYYNEYNFYLNSNHFDIADDGKTRFPSAFTMACYNDENHTLIFMGFFMSVSHFLEEKYLEDIEGNWKDFIDQYYGVYYDFSQ